MATFAKVKLGGSTDGRGVKVAATATPGTTIHTGSSTTTDYDEVWLWAYNSDSADILLTIEWGGTTAPDDNISVTIPSLTGAVVVVEGLVIKGNASPLVVKAFAGTTNKIVIFGYVNRISA